jgi:hypothetical protein
MVLGLVLHNMGFGIAAWSAWIQGLVLLVHSHFYHDTIIRLLRLILIFLRVRREM